MSAPDPLRPPPVVVARALTKAASQVEPSYYELVRAYKRALILGAVAAADGNRTRAAAQLGMNRSYLLRLIRELGIALPRPRRGVPTTTHAPDALREPR